MPEIQQLAYQYQVGGGLLSTAKSYVFRPADDHLYEALKAGEFCYVFNCRQMGKTSLRNQTMQRLIADQYHCISVDLTTIGSGGTSAEWYQAFAGALHGRLSEQIDFEQWWAAHGRLPPIRSLHLYFQEILLRFLPNRQIVIFIDEIDTVLGLEFDASDFFALIRACFNLRGEDPAYRRLTFVLFGVATPASLVRDPVKTPFNIGKDISLSGLEFERSLVLAEGLVSCVPNPEAVLREILAWTGGQPFLTQKLCDLVQQSEELEMDELVEGKERAWIEEIVRSHIIENWLFESPKHFRTIQERLFAKPEQVGRILGLYQKILQNGEVVSQGSDEELELRLSGLVVQEAGRVRSYNQIYQEVFDRTWVEQALSELRPYAKRLRRWLESGCQDKSQLLQDQELLKALATAKGRSLADEDYRFFAASQDMELSKVRKRIRWGIGVLGVTIVGTISALLAASQATKLAEAAQQEVKAAQQEVKAAQQEVKAADLSLAAADVRLKSAMARDKLSQERPFNALLESLRAGHQLKQLDKSAWEKDNTRMQVLGTLLQAVHETNERNSLIHQEAVTSVVFSPDGKTIASASWDNTVKLWSRDGRALRTFKGHQDDVTSVAFSPDGKTIASASWDNTVKLWSRDGRALRTFKAHQDDVWSVAFSPDGKTIASASRDNTVKLWTRDGRALDTFSGYQSFVWSRDKRLKLWIRDGQELYTSNGYRSDVWSVTFSPDGRRIILASGDNTLKLWTVNLGKLMLLGCDLIRDYLNNSQQASNSDKAMCTPYLNRK
ncbi:MAG: AAA-like domain-containing protein [Phormidium tanganyikae FI6-MK23]|nr:AAA-like domain-containing protein [Phormidium tanganyikae FI6-MK23]